MPSRRRLPRLACLVLAGAIVMSPAAAADGAAADIADILRPVQGGGLGERILREVDVTAERVTTRYQVDFRRALSFPVVPGRGGEALSPETRAELRSLARALASPELARERFLIAGHADAAGAESRNIALSYERARVVRDYLVEAHGIDPRRLVAAGWGSIRLPEGSTPRSGHGRRVEIALLVRALSSQPAGRLVRRRGDAAPIAMIDPVGDPHAFEAGLRLPAIRPAPEGCIQPTHDLDDFQPGGPIIGCIPIRTRR